MDPRRVARPDRVALAAGWQPLAATKAVRYGLALAMLVLLVFPITGTAGPYKLSVLVRQGDTLDGQFLRTIFDAAFNDNQDLLFGASFAPFPPPPPETGLFVNDQLVVRSGDLIGDTRVIPSGRASINNSGQFAFVGGIDDGSFLGGPLTVFTRDRLVAGPGMTIDGRQLIDRPGSEAIPGIPDINDNGNIAFKGIFTGGEGIFLDDRLIVETGDTIDGRTLTSVVAGLLPFKPSLNNSGEIAFVGTFEGGEGVFTQEKLIAATGDVIDSRQLTGIGGQASINNPGDVVFKAGLEGGETALFVNRSLVVATGDTIGGRTLSSVSVTGGDVPTLNDSGVVAFRAFVPNEDFPGQFHEAIFTQNHLVAAGGDILDGQRLVFMESPIINNNGDILFQSNLFDGTNFTGVLVLAELIPEPASGGLAVVAAALVLLYYVAVSRIRVPRRVFETSRL